MAWWMFRGLSNKKKMVNYHEEMDSTQFEEWFSKVVDKIERNAVIVMDSAPYKKLRKEWDTAMVTR